MRAEYGYHDNFQLAQTDLFGHHSFYVSREVRDKGTLGMARPSRIRFEDRGGITLFDSGFYSYDGAGNITAIGSDRYTYDGAGRLLSGTVKQAGATRREDYSYDAFDNPLTVDRDGAFFSEYIVTDQNRVLHTSDQPAQNWFYDVAGNLTSINKDSSGSPEIEMTYDALGMQNAFRRDSPLGLQFVVYVFGPGNLRLLTFEGASAAECVPTPCGGDMFVVDFERIPGLSSNFILGHVRAPKATVIAEIEASGFKLVEEIDLKGLKENYLLRFRKVATPER